MIRLLTVLGSLLLAAACARSGAAGAGGPIADASPTTTGEKTMPSTHDEPADAGAKASGPTLPTAEREWHVYDNGLRCVTFPCPTWTADADGESVQCTGLDLSALGLSEERAGAVHKEIYRGEWIVRGRIVEGPRGPAGPGRIMQVLELVKKVPPRKAPEKDAP